jgi:hypothetical protein
MDMPDKERTLEPNRARPAIAHRPLADLAEQQHGVVSTRQMEGLGYSRDAISYGARSGRLHRLHRGVYAVGHKSLTWHSRCLAAVLACEPNALASHTSAAWLWGLLTSRPGTFHVTAPTRRHKKKDLHLHYARLADEDRTACEGIPATGLARTLLDFAATASPTRLDRAIQRSEERRIFDLRAVDALLGRAGSHPGRARLRRAVAIYRDEPAFSRSRVERRFLELVKSAGLPAPSMNFNESGYELDAYWRAERFAVELDVYETHGSRAAFEQDRRRQENLKIRGIEMIRITGPRLDREPATVVESVANLLEQRRRQVRMELVRSGSSTAAVR